VVTSAVVEMSTFVAEQLDQHLPSFLPLVLDTQMHIVCWSFLLLFCGYFYFNNVVVCLYGKSVFITFTASEAACQ